MAKEKVFRDGKKDRPKNSAGREARPAADRAPTPTPRRGAKPRWLRLAGEIFLYPSLFSDTRVLWKKEYLITNTAPRLPLLKNHSKGLLFIAL